MSRSSKQERRKNSAISPARVSSALIAAGDIAYEWDVASGAIAWSENAAVALGFDDVSAISGAADFVARVEEAGNGRECGHLGLAPRPCMAEGFSAEFRFRRGDGAACWLQDRGRLVGSESGAPGKLTGTLRVITAEKERDARVHRLAFFDELSGFVNRAGLREAIDDAVFEARRDSRTCAYLAVGIDNMSRINETFGYAAGDAVIVTVGDRLDQAVGADGTIGRIGGNQYGVLVPCCDDENLMARARRLLDTVRNTLVETEVGPVPATISIGAVLLPRESRRGQDAMARAEDALAQAKSKGRDRFVVYTRDSRIAASRRRNRELLEQVVLAIDENRLILAYQPIVRVPDGAIGMYEGLIRMRADNGESIPAGRFMPVVEELGLIRIVDRRVLEMALRELCESTVLCLSINVSGLTVSDTVWLDTLTGLVRGRPDIAQRLTVEITETAALRDPEESARFASRLRDMGCRVALDDFGAGHSSFRQLKAMAIDILKIDGSFVRGISESGSSDNRLLVRTLVDLARGFGLETVAEWVESPEDARLLTAQGVDYLQGFLFGEPSFEKPWLDGGAMPLLCIPDVSPQTAAIARIASGLTA